MFSGSIDLITAGINAAFFSAGGTDIVEESYRVGYEDVDKRHSVKRPDLRGQFVYASLVELNNKIYAATIKFDDSKTDKRALFKDISITQKCGLCTQDKRMNRM